MRKRLTNNLGLKILSVMVAFVIWLVILNVDDPTITTRITGIDVKTVNGESITGAGMYYEVESNDQVTVVVKGKKSIVDTLTESDFYAVADLSKYSITNAVPIEVSLAKKYASEQEIVEGKNQTMMLSVENYLTKQFEVMIQTKGEPAKDYYISVDEINASPNRINVSAPESVMKKISEVRIDVYVNDVNKEFRVIAEPKAYDVNGTHIKSDKIKFGVNSISVSANPLKVKSIPVEINIAGNLEDGYIITQQECSLKELRIAGTKTSLDKIDKIVLDVDVTGYVDDYSGTFDLKKYLSNEIKIISDDKECEVTLEIEKLVEKKIEFSAKDIKFLNLRTDVMTDYETDKKLSFTVRGLSDAVENLDASMFAPNIDMEKLIIGTQKVSVKFEDVEGVEIIDGPYIEITLKEVIEQPEEPTISDDVVDENSQEVDDTIETENTVIDNNVESD
ncbi:MAG: hypothetical protein IJD02_01720 [Lachnospiraceae bacterium]|nr:hypothetical protein [Lachnospiraceae bacterium]